MRKTNQPEFGAGKFADRQPVPADGVGLGAGQGSSMQAPWAIIGLVRLKAKAIALTITDFFTAMTNLHLASDI